MMQCTTTGKKYVGQTMQTDMSNYCGSGIYWQKHCKKHGGWNRTNIIVLDQKWLSDIEKANEWLSLLPNQYWLTEDYANIVSETVDDNPFLNNTVHAKNSHITNKKNKTGLWDPKTCQISVAARKEQKLGWWNSEEQKRNGSKGRKATDAQRIKCLVCLKVMRPVNLSQHQKASKHEGKERIL